MKSKNKTQSNLERRRFLKWTPPIVTAVVLPAHAQTSVTTTSSPTTPVPVCDFAPIVVADAPSKCAGDPPVGQATMTLRSNGSDLTIKSISHNAPAGNNVSLPALPTTVTSSTGVQISWMGPASDVQTCLPIAVITFTVIYTCNGDPMDSSFTFNLIEILAAAIP